VQDSPFVVGSSTHLDARANGQLSEAMAAAKAGLALLPPETSATVMSRGRKLLHVQMDDRRW